LTLPTGAVIDPGITFPAQDLGLPDMLNAALQLDGNKQGDPYEVLIDDATLTAWGGGGQR
jgi:hypothetical protein